MGFSRKVGLNRTRNPTRLQFPGSCCSDSSGLNWNPSANQDMRLELRADWYDGDATPPPYRDGTKDSQFLLGLDAIVMF